MVLSLLMSILCLYGQLDGQITVAINEQVAFR